MNYNKDNWPFKWFGYWKEYGKGYENCPSIKDFIDKDTNALYDKIKLVHYIENAPAVVATTRWSFDAALNKKSIINSLCSLTDGNWLWFDNIGDLILNDNLVIPEKWYQEIVEKSFVIPHVDQDQLNNTERFSFK